MNPNKLNRAQLALFAANTVAILTAGDAGDVPAGVQTALAAEISPMVTDLGTDEQAAVDAMAAYRAAVQDAEFQRKLALVVIQNTKNSLRAAGCEPTCFAAVGYDAPVTSPVIYVPNTPTECAAEGSSNGVIRVTFTGNNRSGYVIYEIWRRQGDDGLWQIVGTTGKQTWDNRGIIPGQYYEYKVRANAARHYSEFSNSAVVYGS